MKKLIPFIIAAVLLTACKAPNQMLYNGNTKRVPNPKVGH